MIVWTVVLRICVCRPIGNFVFVYVALDSLQNLVYISLRSDEAVPWAEQPLFTTPSEERERSGVEQSEKKTAPQVMIGLFSLDQRRHA